MGTLYIVATPIGNLDDLSRRARDTLAAVSVIYAEDTRVTAKLLQSQNIDTPMKSYHQHSTEKVVEGLVQVLRDGSDVALVSDAGTPGINDPGGALVAHVLRELEGVVITPIPGPNAAIAALSVSGFPADRYRYLGFVPHKKGRQTFFAQLAEHSETQVFYESKHRIQRALEQMRNVLGERSIVVARELTKQFETFYRGTAAEVAEQLTDDEIRGEFVVVVGPLKQ